MEDIGPERSVLVARDADGAMVAASIVLWVETPRIRYAVIEDLSVDPAARSHGIGAAMVAAIEAEAKRRDMGWFFLESGKDNERAHAFFERHGFETVSHVFAKRL